MRALFLIILLLGTLWDGITTGLGISVAIGANDFLGYGMCFVGGSLVLGFSFLPLLSGVTLEYLVL